MEDSLKAWRGFVVTASVLFFTGSVASWLEDKGDLLMWFAHHRHPVLDYFFYYITHGGEVLAFVLVGVYFLLKTEWRKAIFITALGLSTTLISYVMKMYFQHERPALFLKRLGWTGPTDVLDYHMLIGHTSFPSGHSMAAWALFTFVAALFRRPWISAMCIFIATSVSISRIYLMAHFLQDVTIGAIVGAGIGYGMYYIGRKHFRKG